ncbi:MAG: ABC transporter permease [Clostridiales bacterium]|nr:ABC transporter permease [Clostridiales bacterium]
MRKDSFFGRNIRPLIRHKVFSLVLILVALVILFTIWSAAQGGQFFKASTLKNVLNSIVLTAFLAIGAGCLLISGNLDLSQAAVGAFGGIILASAVANWHLPWFVGIIFCLVFCAVLGAINAIMVTRFRFPAFIATLAMMSMAKGLMYVFSAIGKETGVASNVSVNNNVYIDFIGKGTIGKVPFGIIVMLIFVLFYGILISKTKFGLKVMLLGGNPAAANLAGINAKKITFILFMNSSILGGVAGVFSTSRLGQGSLLALQTNQFTGLTAAILGGISFGGGAGGMGGAFVGLLILNTFQIGMGVVGVNPYWVNVFSGIILLIALATDFLAQKRASNPKAS